MADEWLPLWEECLAIWCLLNLVQSIYFNISGPFGHTRCTMLLSPCPLFYTRLNAEHTYVDMAQSIYYQEQEATRGS